MNVIGIAPFTQEMIYKNLNALQQKKWHAPRKETENEYKNMFKKNKKIWM